MKVRPIFISLLILAGLLLSAFASLPSANSTGQFSVKQATATVPAVVETVVVPATIVVPVTGTDSPPAGWTLILYAVLALLGIVFLLSLFAPRRTHDHVADHGHDHTHNPPPDV